MHWHFDYHDHHGTVAQAGMIIIITGPGAGPAWPGSLRPCPVAVTVTLQLEINLNRD
jgi:hypothetical protein